MREVLNRSDLCRKGKRIKKALTPQKLVRPIDVNSLTPDKLAAIAKRTNAARLHCSGNCTLLSRAVLYNLSTQEERIAAKNSYPPHKALSEYELDKLVPTKPSSISLSSVAHLEENIINNYQNKGERFFIVNVRYKSKALRSYMGHSFNGVVLFGKNDKPYVQFVDAWKTSKRTYTAHQLAKRYPSASFSTRVIDA